MRSLFATVSQSSYARAAILTAVVLMSVVVLQGLKSRADAASYTAAKDTLTSIMINEPDVVHSFEFTSPASLPAGSEITITFPLGFNVTAAPTGGSGLGTGPTFGFTVSTMTATCGTGGCAAGTMTITGGEATNPGIDGFYILEITNDQNADAAAIAVAISDSDFVSVSAVVDPVISFNIGSQTPASPCSELFGGNGGAVALGTLSVAAVKSSDQTSPLSIDHICSRVTTNATGGATVTVRSASDGLASVGTPLDVIDSAPTGVVTGLSAGSEAYGVCVDSSGGSGSALGATPSAVAPYNSTCTDSDHNVGGVDGVDRILWTVSGPTDRAHMSVLVKAAIDGSTAVHNDYEDTLTFIVTGNF